MNKLAVYQEQTEDKGVISFNIYKNEEILKEPLSSMDIEDLNRLQRMVDGLAHKIYHVLHFKKLRCCPCCHVKARGKK